MKKLILVATFVTQLGSIAFANKTEQIMNAAFDQSNSESFQTFIKKQAPMFYQVDTDNWKTFQRVVTYFTESKSDLLKMTEKEKKNFLLSSEQIVKELSIMNSIGSEKWIKNITSTTAIIKFTWDVLEEKNDIEFEKAPLIIETPKVVDINFIGK